MGVFTNSFSPSLVQVGSSLNYFNFIKNLFGTSIVAYYKLDEKTGIVAVDSVGNHNGVYSGVVLNQDGFDLQNKSISVDNNTDYVNLYSSALNTDFPRSEGSIQFWIKPNSTMWTDLDQYLFMFLMNESNYITLRKVVGYGVSTLTLYYKSKQTTFGKLTSSHWQQLTVTWSVSNDRVIVYRNSVEMARITGISALTGNLSANWCKISNNGSNAAAALCNLSHFLILNKEASQSEIYNAYRMKKAFILFEGDSRTANYLYDNYTVDNLQSKFYITENKAVGGGTIATMTSRGAAADALIRTGIPNYIVVFTGVNDSALSAQQLYDGLSSYCNARKTAGYKVIICTEIDSSVPGWTAKYQALNTLIRNDHSFADAMADLGADSRLQDNTNRTYYRSDGVHPTVAGAQVYAEIVSTVINANT